MVHKSFYHKDHLRAAVDVLADMVFHSQYPQAEIDREVEVICDEIESYNDSPAELIYDEFENQLFSGHPLGHNILGTAEQLRTYTTADAQRFIQRYYLPMKSVFFAYGDIDFRRLVTMLEKIVPTIADTLKAPVTPEVPALTKNPVGITITRHRQTHQAHVMIGTRAYAINHPRRMALYLLTMATLVSGLSTSAVTRMMSPVAAVWYVES